MEESSTAVVSSVLDLESDPLQAHRAPCSGAYRSTFARPRTPPALLFLVPACSGFFHAGSGLHEFLATTAMPHPPTLTPRSIFSVSDRALLNPGKHRRSLHPFSMPHETPSPRLRLFASARRARQAVDNCPQDPAPDPCPSETPIPPVRCLPNACM